MVWRRVGAGRGVVGGFRSSLCAALEMLGRRTMVDDLLRVYSRSQIRVDGLISAERVPERL